MKKLIAICLVAVLAIFVAAGTVTAGLVTLGSTYEGVASWTTETAAPGGDGVSAKLYWPAPYNDDEDNYITPRAWISVDVPDTTVGNINSWDYWSKAPENYCVNLTFYVDTEAENYEGRDYDMTITALPENDPPLADVWMNVDQGTIGGYDGAYICWANGTGSPSYKFSWSSVQDSYGSGTVLSVKTGKGVIGTSQIITAYVDDFSMNGVEYAFIPEPATICLLGLGGLLLRRRKRA